MRLPRPILGAITALMVPVEVVYRLLGKTWTLHGGYTHYSPVARKTITAPDPHDSDRFTAAPNLRAPDGSPSRASHVHDVGWEGGIWDDGSTLTFDENNQNFRQVLDSENHYECVKDVYEHGVGLDRMRAKWSWVHGHG